MLFPFLLLFSSFSSQFSVIERIVSWTSTFDIVFEGQSFATAYGRFFKICAAYDLTSSKGEPLGLAQGRFFSWGTMIDLYDTEKKIGRIEENVFRVFPWAEYRLFDAENKPVGQAKMNVLGTRFEVHLFQEPEKIFATISRPFIRFFRDRWETEILSDPERLDSRFLIFLAVFQTDHDNRARYRKEIQQDLLDEQEAFEGRRFF